MSNIMRITTEVDLADLTDERFNLNDEITSKITKEVLAKIKATQERNVIEEISEKINKILNTSVNAIITQVIDETPIVERDNWGKETGKVFTVRDRIKERFSIWIGTKENYSGSSNFEKHFQSTISEQVKLQVNKTIQEVITQINNDLKNQMKMNIGDRIIELSGLEIKALKTGEIK